MSALEQFTAALERAGSHRHGANWQCLAHDDHHASLSVSEGRDGVVLAHCHAGCTFQAVIAAVPGVAPGDLNPNGNGHRREVESYSYVDERGEPLFEVVRFDPKDFRQR